ncbi:MAG TPA: hypothetical protein VGF67_32530 [Ktedonobacteraceae bacterium]
MDQTVVPDPFQELTPWRITDGPGKVVVLEQIGNLQVFHGNQVVRRDERVCPFPGKIFTLPTDEPLCDGLIFLPAREVAMQPLELLLCLLEEAKMGNRVPVGVHVAFPQADIDAHRGACDNVSRFAFRRDCQRGIVAIGSLDLVEREGSNLLFPVAYQTKPTNATAISEREVFAIRITFPSGMVLLIAAVVVGNLGRAFLPRLLLSTVVMEALDS